MSKRHKKVTDYLEGVDPQMIIPLIGNGLHNQATNESRLSWDDLMTNIAKENGLFCADKTLIVSPIMRWESLLTAYAAQHKYSAHISEGKLRKKVAQWAMSLRYGDQDFMDRIRSLNVADILTTNYDLSLENGCRRRPVQLDPETTVYPINRCKQRPAGGRCWHIHGDCTKPSTIMLGLRSYGCYIRHLEAAFRQLKYYERSVDRRDRKMHDAMIRERPDCTWVHLMMNAPLIIIGLGMYQCEWPLYWALTQRQRYHARSEQVPVIYMDVKKVGRKDNDYGRRLQCLRHLGVSVVDHYPNHDAMWDDFFTACGHLD